MKRLSIFLFIIQSIFIFSQNTKELSIQDSLTLKYPDRKKVAVTVGEIFYKSEISKKTVTQVVSKKFSNTDFRTVRKDDVEIAKTYYQLHYLWILIDKTLTNFTNDEIDEIKSKISNKKSENPLIKRFRNIEKECIENFKVNFN